MSPPAPGPRLASAPAPVVVDVGELVERSRMGARQAGVMVLIAGCLVMDGFDLQVMGYVAPALIRDWGLPPASMGPVFSAGLLGLFLGSLACGTLADRAGRRPVLMGALLVFSVFTLLTPAARSVPELVALRALAGVGLGGMMPNATALVGEYSPRRRRITTMMVVTNGFMLGAMAAGLVASWLLPAFGWRSVFYVGGALPLALLYPMWRWLPESLQFLSLRGRGAAALGRWVRLVDPGAPAGEHVRYLVREERAPGMPLAALLRAGRAPATALLWAVNFTNVLVAYFVSSWLPTLVRDAGHSTRSAVLVGTAVQAGGAVGTLVLGFVLQRRAFTAVLGATFACAAVCVALLGQPALPLPALGAVAFCAGWGIFGGQPGVNALAATYYPTELRSTGLGAALAVGRFGAILGPLLAGALLVRGWSTPDLFHAAAIPAAISAVIVLAMRRATARAGGPPP